MNAVIQIIRFSALPLALALLVAYSASAQLNVDGYDPRRHDRFAEDREGLSFLGDDLELDLSGVGRASDGPGRWVTMISPTQFLTSNHARADEGTVTFYLGNSLTSPTVECAIDPDSGSRVGETDVWLGSLVADSCDTSQLTYYALASPSNYAGRKVAAIGRSDRTSGDNTTSMRLGRNLIDFVETGDYFRGVADHIVFVDDTVQGNVSNLPPWTQDNLVDSEFRFANGESGGPTFVRTVTGEYELLGIHSYLGYTGTHGEQGFEATHWASIDTYLPTERNAIYDQVRLSDPDFTFTRNLDNQPVGEAPDREFFPIQSGIDCNLDNIIDANDLNCTTWKGSLANLDFVLTSLGVPLGDADLDGRVGFSELLRLSGNFNSSGNYTDGDFSLDGFIDFTDFLILTRNFGVDFTQSSAAAVPEPDFNAAWIILIVCTPAWACRRSRNSR